VQIYHNTSVGELKFGPAFEKEFLLEVFRLQVELTQLGQDEGAGLEQICFAPITNRGESPTLSQCTIQSIFGYFNDDFVRFNRTTVDGLGFENNYLNVIEKCTQ
jgi:Niemann-Pick C1 protein